MSTETGGSYRDGGYGWVVVIAGFFVNFITDGLIFSYGILLTELVNVFQSYRSTAGIPVSLSILFMYICGPIAGHLCHLYGHTRIVVIGAIISTVGLIGSAFVEQLYHLYFTYGLLVGIGNGLMFAPASICVLQNFDKRRAIANGIAVCGSGVGTFAFNALTRYLLDTYGWRGTFILLAGSSLHGVGFGLLLNTQENGRDCKREEQLKSNASNDRHISTISKATENVDTQAIGDVKETYTMNGSGSSRNMSENSSWHGPLARFCRRHMDLALLKSFNFQMFLLSTLVLNFGFVIPFHFLPDQARENGNPEQKAVWLSSTIGISSTVGRVIVGWIGDRKSIDRFWLFLIVIVLAGTSTGFSVLTTSFEWKLIYSCVFGLFIAGYVALQGVVLADFVGIDKLSNAFGLNMASIAIGATFGTPIGGWLFDVSGNYNLTFIMSGLLFVIGGVIILIPKLITVRRSFNVPVD